ncbi:MAG TPA: c-type cytochrome [Burkholderiales bacterium]|nr:c-type cytochrome [Burkholderiales bacterium]
MRIILLTALVQLGLVTAYAATAQPFEDAEALAREKGCFECHAIGRTEVGPSFSAIARRYRYDLSARERLPTVIRTGSIGHWGERFAMWPQRQVDAAEARMLVDWILSQ